MDSPTGSASSPHRRNNNMQSFSLEDTAEETSAANGQRSSQGPLSRHDADVFDLSMDYDEDDQVLLDWEQYAGLKRTRCCGMDCTRLVNRLPFASSFPPTWWYQLSRKQRQLFWYLTGGVTAFVIILISILASSGNHRPNSNSGTAEGFLSHYPLCQWDQWRLPNDIKPTAYDVNLIVDLEEPYTVAGSVTIHLESHAPTPCVVLHSSGMTIGKVSLGAETAVGVCLLCSLLVSTPAMLHAIKQHFTTIAACFTKVPSS